MTRVLVVDDSAFNRRTVSEMLASIPGVEVVGKATDGDEALRLASDLDPDLITLDLEMPRMDGFTFLRLLMARKPVPVIVVSGYSAKENVFRALELGAIDFVAKPARGVSGDLVTIRDELARKVQMVKSLSPLARDREPGTGRTSSGVFTAITDLPRMRSDGGPPQKLCVIASSTGGPTALLELFARFPQNGTSAVVVAQHMPERFTRTFAERLAKISPYAVTEAFEGQVLRARMAVIAPGGKCIEVVRRGTDLVVRVLAPQPEDRYVPSADRLFASAARVFLDRTIGVVLTGMGDDGAAGVLKVAQTGGAVMAESPDTAIVNGMPSSALRTGVVTVCLPLRNLAEKLAVALV